jgi:hypothetical protein
MAEEATSVTGGCLCGAVRYEAEVFLANGTICHCRMCQRNSGQPADMTVLIKAGTLRYLGQEPRYYRSSEGGKRGFCGECGSHLVWQAVAPEDDWSTNLSVGSLDDPAAARMGSHIYADRRLPWYRVCEGLPTFEEKDGEAMLAFLRRMSGA